MVNIPHFKTNISSNRCLFLRKDSGQERKLREGSISPCLEHYKKVKEREILVGNLKKLRKHQYLKEKSKIPHLLLLFIFLTIHLSFLFIFPIYGLFFCLTTSCIFFFPSKQYRHVYVCIYIGFF